MTAVKHTDELLRKRQRPPFPNNDAYLKNGSQNTPQAKKLRLQQPRKANGRFAKIRKPLAITSTGVSTQTRSPEESQNKANMIDAHHTSSQAPLTEPGSTKTDRNEIAIQIHNLFHILPKTLDSTPSAPHPPSTAPSSNADAHKTPTPSGDHQADQSRRTAAIVNWLQYTRTYDQKTHLVHPFNLPPPTKIRPDPSHYINTSTPALRPHHRICHPQHSDSLVALG